MLDDVLSRLSRMSPEQQEKLYKSAQAINAAAGYSLAWRPNDGPQREAYWCKADVLLYGRHVLRPASPPDADPAWRAAAAGIERYGRTGGEWPCGAGGEYSPALMIGMAGIAFFYARLHDPSLPSPLLPRSADFSAA